MLPSEISDVLKHATRFRRALERCGRSCGYVGSAAFPLGSCGDAVLLLGTYLIDVNVGPFDHVHGERGSRRKGDWGTHAWLQRNDLIIDITADQFDDVKIPVVVAKNPSWYRGFRMENRGIADLRLDPSGPAQLASVYNLLIQDLKSRAE